MEYKLSKQILIDQKIEAKEGKQITIDLDGAAINGTIKKIDGDQVFIETNE
jgi:FKBP-type peptidyl-prolyl cis-trans isomerase 2